MPTQYAIVDRTTGRHWDESSCSWRPAGRGSLFDAATQAYLTAFATLPDETERGDSWDVQPFRA